jgi:hypothetical protein
LKDESGQDCRDYFGAQGTGFKENLGPFKSIAKYSVTAGMCPPEDELTRSKALKSELGIQQALNRRPQKNVIFMFLGNVALYTLDHNHC